jgi:hypothetical protein
MSKHTTTISRLASANPARPDDELGRSPEAQATLRQILAEEREPDTAPSARRALPSSRRLVAVLAVLVLGTGTAFAATDPFGWWSANPQTALYQTDLTRHVTTPTATGVNCTPLTGGLFQCAARSAGRPYRLIDHIQAVHANPFSRSAITASVNQALQAGRITPAIAQRIRTDLSRVSDQYLATLYTPHGYGSYGLAQPDTGRGRVPPAGVPSFLACQMSAGKIICRYLNGDQAPAGSGIYEASPTADWRPAPPARTQPSAPARATPTPAEMQLLSDILRYLTASSSSSSP